MRLRRTCDPRGRCRKMDRAPPPGAGRRRPPVVVAASVVANARTVLNVAATAEVRDAARRSAHPQARHSPHVAARTEICFSVVSARLRITGRIGSASPSSALCNAFNVAMIPRAAAASGATPWRPARRRSPAPLRGDTIEQTREARSEISGAKATKPLQKRAALGVASSGRWSRAPQSNGRSRRLDGGGNVERAATARVSASTPLR